MTTSDPPDPDDDDGKHKTPYRWKSTLREGLAAAVGFLPIFVLVADQLNWDDYPKLAGIMATAAALATALAAPAGRDWTTRYLTGYSSTGKHHDTATPEDPPESDTGDSRRQPG